MEKVREGRSSGEERVKNMYEGQTTPREEKSLQCKSRVGKEISLKESGVAWVSGQPLF